MVTINLMDPKLGSSPVCVPPLQSSREYSSSCVITLPSTTTNYDDPKRMKQDGMDGGGKYG
jgi:hypothetical protein